MAKEIKIKNRDRDEYDEDLFESLRKLRLELAESKDVPPFVIFSNAVLKEFAYFYPSERDLFLAIKGVGENKLEEYGEVFMKLIRDYIECAGISNKILDKRREELKLSVVPEKPKVNVKERTEMRKTRVKEMIIERKSIEEMALDLELTNQTVVNYIDKLLKEGVFLDVQYIKDSIAGYNDIVKSFEKNGLERMGPVYADLGGNVEFADIALVRVLMQAK